MALENRVLNAGQSLIILKLINKLTREIHRMSTLMVKLKRMKLSSQRFLG